MADKADVDIQKLTDDIRITGFTPINNRREILVTLSDKALLDDASIEGYEILPVYYVGTRPLRPTGEIIFQPKAGVDYNRVRGLVGDHIQYLRSKKYGVHVVKPDKPYKLLEIANQIYESGLVEWCEPNFLLEIEKQQTVNPTDPRYPHQYYLHQGNGIDINAPQAWEITTGLCPVRVAVIDDGVEAHEDLAGRVVAGFTPLNPNGFGAPVVNLPPANEGIVGHGQACAGIIGASHNTLGIAGIFPNAEIVPVNIFHSWFLDPLRPVGQRLRWVETAENIADAINWTWDEGEAEVLNNSWGYSTTNPGDIDESGQIIQAINNARTLGRGGLGSVVVFSSGNSHQNFSGVTFPANVNGVVAVGAIDRNGNIWNYSSRGPDLDLVAPSGNTGGNGDVETTDRMGNLGYDPGNYTDGFGGTSAAAPQVSGVAALMLSVNPGLTETQVRAILQNTATDMGTIGFDNTYGYGRVNAHAAVHAAVPPISGPDGLCASTTNYTLQNVPSGATVSWTATPSGLFTNSSGVGATAPLSAIGSSAYGAGTLTFTIETDCGEYQANKAIWVGVPDANDIKIAANYYPICPNEDTYFNAWYEGTEPGNQDADIVYYDWHPPLSNCITAGIKNEVLICNFPSDAPYLMRISAENSCGQGGYRYEYLNILSCFYYMVSLSPNPANGTVNLNLTETPLDEEAKTLLQSSHTGSAEYQEYSFSKAEYRVKIYDMHAIERYCKEAGPDSLQESLDISHLPPGLYIMHIEHSRGTIIRQLKVE